MIQQSVGGFTMPNIDMQRLPEAMQDGLRSTRDMIEEYPASAVFAAFGIGLGMGVGLAVLLSQSSMFAPPQRSRYW